MMGTTVPFLRTGACALVRAPREISRLRPLTLRAFGAQKVFYSLDAAFAQARMLHPTNKKGFI
ncbi:hypothetical protein [Dictyobacter formicarum]|uniref:hypothetical protein n=1 Tax=Dictyobacter formicarum TaxID=2778368 RepID=UPI00191557FF|nr:hypothetical protein [Dictyobacter formicarum]